MTDREAAFPAPPSRWASRLAPSRVAAVAVLASIPVKLLRDPLGDPDVWWHLRTGELIASTRSIPHSDPYSFTAFGSPWVVQEWGSELLLHWLREAFGLFGILAFRALVLFAVYALVARMLVRRMGRGIGTWMFLGLVAYAGSANWTERPNLLSFLLFAVTLELLDRRGRAIWWFVPLAALWANLHGMVILGIGLVLLVAAVEGLKAAVRWPGADAAWSRRLAIVGAMGILATLANPVGPRLLVQAFRLLALVRDVVTEWASPDFHEASSLVFLTLALLTIAALALTPTRPDPTDVALALAFLFLALQAVRNLAVAAIVLGLACARWLPSAVASVRPATREPRDIVGPSSLALGALGVLLALGGLAGVLVEGLPRSNQIADIVDEKFPVAAIDALNLPGVRVFVLDAWSGMVLDRAWPNVHVYVDLRQDFYGSEIVNRYRRTIAAFPGWDERLDAACVTHVLIRRRDPLAQVLDRHSAWKLLREDARSVTFARRAPASGCEAFPIP